MSRAAGASRRSAHDRAGERLRALREREVRAAVAAHVREHLREVRDAVGAGDRRDLQRAEDAERAPGGVHEARARVTGDARGDRGHEVRPAVAVIAQADATLGREQRHAGAQLGVAVGEDGVALLGPGGRQAGRTAQRGHRRVDLAVVGRIELDDADVVVGAGVRVGLPSLLHRGPRVVDERAGLGGAGDLDRRAVGQALRLAAVGVGVAAGARAVGGLADVHVARGIGVDEVRGALRAVGERLHTRVHSSRGGRGPGAGGGSTDQRDSDGESGDEELSHGTSNAGQRTNLRYVERVRVWIDLTNSPHVLVMRPVAETLRARGHEVLITARDFAQTLGLLERLRLDHTAIGRHRGGALAAKGLGLASRSGALVCWARGRGIDVALGHGSNDVSVAAKLLQIPSVTAFDYEWASVQHSVNCRLAARVVVPDAIPTERLARYGAGPAKLRRYPGLKEEYYLADFEPDPAVLHELGLDRGKPLAVVRTPPAVSLYHRFDAPVFSELLHRLEGQQVVVLPRTAQQRAELAGRFTVPERAVDAQSLVAFADLVISAGGTMNREAVALGTPVWTTFEGRLGAVDEALIAQGRLRRLTRADDVVLERRDVGPAAAPRIRRDPALLTDLFMNVS